MSHEEIKTMNAALVALGIDDDTPRSELVRRIVNQCSHIQAYARCLDGFDVSSGVNGCRNSADIARAFGELDAYHRQKTKSLSELIGQMRVYCDHRGDCPAKTNAKGPCFCGWSNLSNKAIGLEA